ncbi:hypothetical protein F3I27_23410 [Pantoea sp. Bo_2]|uniref:DnaT-like ssDNA-binding protein n=1 Tax=unclassified Pantoea TaxID=2630326 RepID=UPI001231A3E9|nr:MULTISPECIES: DnaT-like ssDNA-binding protein [unclassified Pantoea]KAA5935930.1 hypothetical protein F3I57_23015 [Pantoea sp. VH_3]KAA5944891.1 hypothetical protein F3I56_23030 [Pantoea sp. VH_25]KAA5949398.1 hypothetical protein F3I55_22685 [Pantoea sp. VH_24]KAA5955317.1 hypothetical protein F3I53_20355 [Pantoea sp. VH_16]KAA5961378.1 hypothetical protein F3I54_19930 [Pantoea sp. VH_18]
MITPDTDPASPGFNSYARISDLRDFASSRGGSVPDDDTECAQLLFQAMDYLNGRQWKGRRTTDSQPLAWPRDRIVVDGVTLSNTAIPAQLIQAQCRLALAAQEGELDGVLTRGVTMEMAGKVSLQYAGGDDSGSLYFPWLAGLLRGLLAGGAYIAVRRG